MGSRAVATGSDSAGAAGAALREARTSSTTGAHVRTAFGLRLSSDRALTLREATAGDVDLQIGEVKSSAPSDRGPGRLIHHVTAARPTMHDLNVHQRGADLDIAYGDWRVSWNALNGVVRYFAPVAQLGAFDAVMTRVALPLIALRRSLGRIGLHASSVALLGGAWLFVGQPGAGKSTVFRGLLQRGALVISDDFTLVDSAAGHALPGTPELRLWEAPLDVPEAVSHGVVPETGKPWFRLPDSRLSLESVPLLGIVHMSPRQEPGPTELVRLEGLRALELLLASTFDLSVPPAEERAQRFRGAASVVAQASSFVCHYHKDRERLEEHIDRIFDMLTALGTIHATARSQSSAAIVRQMGNDPTCVGESTDPRTRRQ